MGNTGSKATMTSLISELRSIVPKRPLSYGESKQVARNQATRFRQWLGAGDKEDINLIWLLEQQEIPVHFVASYKIGEHSGLTTDQVTGVLSMFINEQEPHVRQRFSLLHEFKHVIDWDDASQLHAKLGRGNPKAKHNMIEWLCNEFAACVLMPTILIKRHWFRTQDPALMASLFNVSREAMHTRLEVLGMLGKPKPAPRAYFRSTGLAPVPEGSRFGCAA